MKPTIDSRNIEAEIVLSHSVEYNQMIVPFTDQLL